MSREMKDSGVEWIGEIPADWDIRKIKNCIVNCFGGCWGEDEKPQNRHLCIRIADFDFDKQLVKSTASTMRSYTQIQLANGMLEDGDIILEKSGGGEKTPVGRTVLYDKKTHPNAMFANFCNVLRPSIETNNKYFAYILKSLYQTTGMRLFFNQTTGIQNLNMKEYLNACISFPLLTEQQQIVHFLDRKCTAIDTAIEKTKKSIEKLEEYKKAVITKAVTKGINPNAKMKDSGVEWIGEIPEGWKVTKTKYLFRILKRIAGREGFDVISITQKGLKIKDITSNEGQVAENYSNYQFVFPGDFAMNHMDLLTGWVDLSALTGVTSPDYRVFHKINESVNDDYYKYVFQSLYFNKVYYGLAQGVAEVGRKRLQAPAFKELKLPCPPADEPAKIAAYIKNKCMAIDALIKKKQTAINKWEEYKKSLIYYAVTGKIDCRNEVIE